MASWMAGLLLVLLALAATPLWAQQKIRIGVYQNLPKVDYQGAGRPQGIFVDVIEAIAHEEGWTLEYVPGTFREGLDRLAAGQIDLMPDVARTTAREALYAFHAEPVLTSWSQVYARPDSRIRSMLDLQGKRVAVLEGSVQQDFLTRMADGFRVQVTLQPQPDFGAAFRAVTEGRADAVVTNRFYGVHNAKAARLEDTAIIFDPSDLYFAGALTGSRALLQAVDRRLRAMKSDPASAYHRSIVQWTQADRPPLLPDWVRWAALGGLLVLAAAAAWVATLRRAAARLRRSEEQQRLLADELGRIFEYSLDAICVGDENLRFVRASGACQKLWGYTPDELVGMKYLDLIPAQDHAAASAVIDSLRKGERVSNLEARSLRKDGSVFHVVWSAAWSARERRWYGIARDDSERRRLLGQLRQARDAALAGDRTKSAFLATMSHELRTPLNSIIGFTGIVLQGLAGPLNDEQRKQLGMVRDSARHLLALINDVLDISKIEAGELRVALAPFDLPRSIERVTAMVGPLAQKKKLALHVRSPQDLATMRGDSRRVEQVLLNLLGNAVKFTESGSITLEVTRVAAFRATEDGPAVPAVALTVSDTGVGIPADSLDMIFQPFQQVDSALSRAHEGTGLGLAICKRLTALMGGTIEARSVPGQGSTFTVTLPLNNAAAQPAAPAQVQAS
jgi:PAS domain S-box-containing protein